MRCWFSMRASLAIFCTSLILFQAQAQHRNENWLALGSWIEFWTGDPALNQDPPLTNAGAALSDASGQLKVYVGTLGSQNGLRGPDHSLADNHPDQTIFNGAGENHRTLFVPRPGQPEHAFLVYNQTYFLTGVEFNRVGWLELDLTDVHPAVVSADFTWFANDMARKRFIVPHPNGTDYWLVLQKMGINLFQAHLITSDGVDPSPVLSQTGAWMPDEWVFGKMIPSSQGTRFASVTEPLSYDWSDTTSALCEVFSFDQTTGEALFEFGLPGLRCVKGVEFSPNGRLLYVAEHSTPLGASQPTTRRLYQYDLESANPIASRLLIHVYSFVNSNLASSNVLALAPDGRIYHAPDLYGTELGIIRRPDELGLACDYVHDGFSCESLIYTVPAPVKRYHDDSLTVAQSVNEGARRGAMQAYPNPAHESLRLHGTPFGAAQAVLRDALGRVVLTQRFVAGAIDINAVASGSYVIEVLDSKGTRLGAARFMKE